MSDWTPPGEFYDGTHFVVKGLPMPSGSLVTREIVVCFHGIKLYHVCFNRLAEYILQQEPDKYIVVQLDEMGRGFSEPSKNGHYTEKEYIPMVLNFLMYLKRSYLPENGILSDELLRFHLIGHSFGGCLASLFTSLYPDLVKSLVLLAPAGLVNFVPLGLIQTRPIIRYLTKTKMEKRDHQIASWRDDFFAHEGESLELENEQVAELTRMYDNNPHAFPSFWATFSTFTSLIDISKNLKVLKQLQDFPIYLLWGDKDEAISFKTSYPKWLKLFNEDKDGETRKCSFETKVYPNGKHGFYLEYHQEVNADILRFLNEHVMSNVKL